MKRLILFLLPAVLFCLNSCGPKVSEVLAKHRPAYDKLRTQLKDIVAKLPAPGSTAVNNSPSAKIDPAPVYDSKNPANSNTAFFDSAQAADGNAKPAYDLIMTSDLAYGLGFTKEPSTLSESVLDERDKVMGSNLEKWLGQFRYVVITRPVKYLPAKAVDDKTFTPGGLDLEYYLVDLSSGEVKVSGRFQATTDATVEFVYKNDGDRRERLEVFANSTLYTASRKKLVDGLNAQTGGGFKAD